MASFIAAMRKLKSSGVSVVFSLVMGDFDFFREEGSGGEPFLLFMISASSAGLCSTSSKSSPLPPCSSVMDAVLTDLLSTSWISSSFFVFFVFFVLLGPGVFCGASRLSMSDTSVGSAGIRRSARPFLGDFLQVFFCQLVIRLKLFLVLISACCQIYKMVVCTELYQRSKPV
jgi:hypothetical protein